MRDLDIPDWLKFVLSMIALVIFNSLIELVINNL